MADFYLVLLMIHFLGLALGVGTSFAVMRLGAASQALEPVERAKFMVRALPVAKNGGIGLGLLILSGIGLVFVRGPAATFALGGPAFHVKLTLVVILAGVLGYSQVLQKRVREAGGGPALATLPKVGAALLLLSVAIVIAAVIAFQ
ncbi:MAG TPA: hypothetical protein VGM44_18425 [Polyangiaceae bacterium]